MSLPGQEGSDNTAATATTTTIGSLMLQKVQNAEEIVKKDPYNLSAWQPLLQHAKTSDASEWRRIYPLYLETFPTAASVWQQFIALELKAGNLEKVKELFNQCLSGCTHAGLWTLYIEYLKKINVSDADLARAYEISVGKVESDIDSGDLWLLYTDFLKGKVADNAQYSQAVMDCRRAYHRAIQQTHRQVDSVWKNYLSWEEAVNKKIFLRNRSEYGPLYKLASTAMREISRMTAELDKSFPSLPPSKAVPESPSQQLLWRRYLDYEKSNPLKADKEETVTARVLLVYEEYLLCFNQYPSIWYDAVMYLVNKAKAMQAKGNSPLAQELKKQADGIFTRAMQACPNDHIIHFAYADFLEAQGKSNDAKQIYQSLLKSEKDDATLIYIQFIRHSRRTGGLSAARKVFKVAIEDPRCGHQVYTAAANIERCSGSKGADIAKKLYLRGMKNEKFAADPEYISQYLSFMISLGDSDNTRALFETVLTTLKPEDSDAVWDKYIEYEALVGDLSNVMKLEDRRRDQKRELEVAQSGNVNLEEAKTHTMDHLLTRFSFSGLIPCRLEMLPSIAPAGLAQFTQSIHDSAATRVHSVQNGALFRRILGFPTAQALRSQLDTGTGVKGVGDGVAAASLALLSASSLSVSFSSSGTRDNVASDASQTVSSSDASDPAALGDGPLPLTIAEGGVNPLPDVTQLTPYRPFKDTDEMILIRPPHVSRLMQELPPPTAWDGAKANVSELLKVIVNTTLPSPAELEKDSEIKRGHDGSTGPATKRAHMQ